MTPFRNARLQYRTVDTRTLQGLKTAERLKDNGWRIISTGLFLIQFERKAVRP
jgi:hypothetical protein